MRGKHTGNHVIVALISVALLLMFCVSAVADLLIPSADGTEVLTSGTLTVDCSNMNQGYIMVKGPESSKRLKIRIKTGKATLNYDLNSVGEYEVYPLQFGNGKYQVSLYRNATGNKYAEEGKVVLEAKLDDELTCFLYPNQYVNYNESTGAVIKANSLSEGKTSQMEVFRAICDFVKNNFDYDFIRQVSASATTVPDIDSTFSTGKGLCQDLAAMTVCMLRSQGIPARLMIGSHGSSAYHAWVTAVVDNKDVFFDPTVEMNASPKDQQYSTERYY